MKWFFFLVIGPVFCVAQGMSVHMYTLSNTGTVSSYVRLSYKDSSWSCITNSRLVNLLY